MLRLLVRAIGLVLLAGAFAAAVIDGARSLADQQLDTDPDGPIARLCVSCQIRALPALARKMHPMLWDPVLVSILYVPDLCRSGGARRYIDADCAAPRRRRYDRRAPVNWTRSSRRNKFG